MTRIVGILLAAGKGERFGGGKLLARLPDGTTVGAASCRRLVAVLPETIAVVRVGDAALADELRHAGARVVECADAGRGMATSLAFGVAAAADADGWVVALADMPWIEGATIARVAEAVARGAAVAAPFKGGERGHPVGFGVAAREALLALDGDDGARSVVRLFGERLVRVDVDDAAIVRDIDTFADLIFRAAPPAA
jgi:molybdenum cofactor cytidylyltransferase